IDINCVNNNSLLYNYVVTKKPPITKVFEQSSDNSEFLAELGSEMKRDALAVIETELPFMLPTEDTDVIILEEFPSGGGYLGKWKDRHHIALKYTFEETEKSGFKRSSSQSLTHELMHQKFAEVSGSNNLVGNPISEYLENDKIVDLPDEEIISNILTIYSEAPEYKEDPDETFVFWWAVTESLSYLGEQYLGYETRPFREKFERKDSIYLAPVSNMVITFSESVEHSEIPSLMENILHIVENEKDALDNTELQREILKDPLKLLSLKKN
ncbi:hypothetical protein ACFL0C_00445, partial [Patescibacteria group bacterium]